MEMFGFCDSGFKEKIFQGVIPNFSRYNQVKGKLKRKKAQSTPHCQSISPLPDCSFRLKPFLSPQTVPFPSNSSFPLKPFRYENVFLPLMSAQMTGRPVEDHA
jgi:hypothetical protein